MSDKANRSTGAWEKVPDHPQLFDHPSDWQKEWFGMPEFIQDKQREFAKIVVRFRNQQDLDDFAELIGQRLTAKTKSMWHPSILRGADSGKKYVSDES